MLFTSPYLFFPAGHSEIPTVYYSPTVRDQVLDTFKTKGNINFLYLLNFTILYCTLERKTEDTVPDGKSIFRINLSLAYSRYNILK